MSINSSDSSSGETLSCTAFGFPPGLKINPGPGAFAWPLAVGAGSVPVSAAYAIGGGTLIYSAVGLPAGLSINYSKIPISGTATVGDFSIGADDPVLVVSDGTYYTTQRFNWTIDSAVAFNDPGEQTNTVCDAASVLVNAPDANSGGTLL